ncbi:hypothetical protein KC354_g15747 [Hortaea werneckii]|nr:hypothetical protein KC354_g15747 [Hortaea werneckii]
MIRRCETLDFPGSKPNRLVSGRCQKCDPRGLAADLDGLQPKPEGIVVYKKYQSAFFGTTLATELNLRQIDTLVIWWSQYFRLCTGLCVGCYVLRLSSYGRGRSLW